VVRLGGEDVERKSSDKAEAGISDVDMAAISEVNPQWDEWVAIQFSGKRFGIHGPYFRLQLESRQSESDWGI
jgi:hypothetical protein